MRSSFFPMTRILNTASDAAKRVRKIRTRGGRPNNMDDRHSLKWPHSGFGHADFNDIPHSGHQANCGPIVGNYRPLFLTHNRGKGYRTIGVFLIPITGRLKCDKMRHSYSRLWAGKRVAQIGGWLSAILSRSPVNHGPVVGNYRPPSS